MGVYLFIAMEVISDWLSELAIFLTVREPTLLLPPAAAACVAVTLVRGEVTEEKLLGGFSAFCAGFIILLRADDCVWGSSS